MVLLAVVPSAIMAQECPEAPAPYYQDFESVTAPELPDCNPLEVIGFGSHWMTDVNPGHGFTSTTLTLPLSPEVTSPWFFTRGIVLTAGTTYRLSYRYGNDSATDTEMLRTSLATTRNENPQNYIADHSTITGGEPVEFTYTNPITISETATYYIGFNAYSGSNHGSIFVDDIALEELICGIPETISATDVTTTSATLNWIPQHEPVTIGYFYGVSTTNTPPTDFQMTSNLTANVSELLPGTTYYAFVRTMCGSVLSEWISTAFTTPAIAGLNDAAFAGLTTYPNPVKDLLTLKNNTIIEKAEVYNITGQLVLQQPLNNTDAQISLEKLSAGAYLLNIYSVNERKTVKLIKQ